MNSVKVFNWKTYFTLLLASIVSIIAILPYILTLQEDVLKSSPLPLPIVILLIFIQTSIMFAIFTFIGLKLANKLGLQIPIIEKIVTKNKITLDVKGIIKKSMFLGVLTGIVIVLLDLIFSLSGLDSLFKQITVPIWQGFLASFYGGISEEIVMRLFLMSLFIWLFSLIIKPKGKIIENKIIMWTSIIITAIIFGLGHLPITSAITTITPIIILRSLLLNGIGGIVFGWLYWKKGLESAMIAHFSADIILHVFFPLILMI